MKIFTHMIVCAAAALLLSGCLFYFADLWLGEETNALHAARRFVLETRRSQALRARREMVARSLAVKLDVIADLVAGRLRLSEAIAQFHKANEMIENFDLDLIPAYRLPTDLAGVGRQVLVWVINDVASWPPEKAQRLLAGFESEYQQLFSRPSLVEPFMREDLTP